MADLRQLLTQRRTRLLTLTGPGGTGKTRLALELVAELESGFDRSWFVDLTTVRDPRLVASAVAQAIDVQEGGRRPLIATLREVISNQQALLLLDNFEHVVDAAGLVAELLGGCPRLVIIVTSREALGVRAEHVYRVVPLPIPDREHVRDGQGLRQIPSVMLFEDRALARRAGSRLTDDALAAVAEICVRLDGLPLAIELVASQVAVLSPMAILKRLQARAPLVASLSRDLPARHQRLESIVAWSYELLKPDARAVFRVCGVFSGGFSAAALEHVGRTLIPGTETLPTLAQLVARSLVQVADDSADEPRFWLLETIREYAAEQLALADEHAEARATHAAYYVELAERLHDSLQGPGMASAMADMAREYGNFRAVFQWASDTGELATGLRLAGAMYRFWLARGPLTEARDWLESALARSHGVPPPIRAAALNAAGVLAGLQLDHLRARAFFNESLVLWKQLGNGGRQAGAHLNLGLVAHVTGDTAEAEREFACAHELYMRLGDRSGQARAVASRARLAREQDDLTTAMRLAQDSLGLFQSVGDNWGTAFQLANIGHLKLALGDPRGATFSFRQALEAWRTLGNFIEIAECLDGVASAVIDAHPRRAAQLLGAAEALRERSGAAVAAVEQRRHQDVVARVQSHLREDTLAAAWREGRGLSADTAIDLALNDDRPTDRTTGVLSRREMEIAKLVADGFSNNDIAERLVVSIKTVETHIQHIFTKLHVKRRAEIAAWAVREGVR